MEKFIYKVSVGKAGTIDEFILLHTYTSKDKAEKLFYSLLDRGYDAELAEIPVN